MLKNILFFLFAVSIYAPISAQQDGLSKVDAPLKPVHSHLRISVLTCGMGNEMWQTFGHSSIRVIDNDKDSLQRDLVYNFGIFDLVNGSIMYTFLKGQGMSVYLDVQPYKYFVYDYIQVGRSVAEQVLLLNDTDKEKILAFLENNALIENRYYNYDPFSDNCCTRTRDVFYKSLGKDFVFGQAFPKGIRVTPRMTYNHYYRGRYWERVLVNFYVGCTTDTVISNNSIMFMPDFLSTGLSGATYKGKKVCGDQIILEPDRVNRPARINQPFALTVLIAIATLAGLSFKRLHRLGKLMASFVLALSGVLGCIMVYFMFFSKFQCCHYNFNFLLVLPTNLFVPFLLNFKGKRIYALVSMCLVIFCLLLHVLKIQIMPLFEVGPFLLALLCVYGSIYRNSRTIS